MGGFHDLIYIYSDGLMTVLGIGIGLCFSYRNCRYYDLRRLSFYDSCKMRRSYYC